VNSFVRVLSETLTKVFVEGVIKFIQYEQIKTNR